MSSVDPGDTGVTDIPAIPMRELPLPWSARALRNSDPTQGIRIAEVRWPRRNGMASIPTR